MQRPDYATPGVLNAMLIADQCKVYEMHQRNIQFLWFLLALAIVVRCEYGGNSDGREA